MTTMTGSRSAGLPFASPKGSSNPFVGPRPFEPGETLYGREAEVDELYYLWKAERIVLLHSPSGAGKSSLLQAGLLPRIEASFDVWGPTRVHQESPAELRAGVNRYLLSAMQGFEEGVPERLRRGARELAGLRLAEYVETRPRRRKKASKSLALLFDQFEEILTVDPLAEEAKQEFFDQLGELLRNPRVWALFVLREDYLAPLDPFLRRVPTNLKNRFRIDLLSLDGAREAMVQPALAGGREFPAADRLLRDLATMKVQRPDGSFAEQIGRYVEPVQLQVVCFRLWEAMPADARSIDAGDLARFGDVTEALGAYYADSVRLACGGDPACERAVREWFGERLITAGGIRGQVLRGVDRSEGLDNELIERLLDTHLVRAEQRAGSTWYELAHDRLIAPVRDDNAAWRAEHLSKFQQRATLWEQQGRPPGLLLKDQELAAAERWSADSVVITGVELRFLEESRKAQSIIDRDRRQARRIKLLGIAALVIGALALVAGAFAVAKMVEANQQRELAVENERKALEQHKVAVAAFDRARIEQERAENERRRAEEEKNAAGAARDEADVQRRGAEAQRQIAETQRQIAEANEETAENERQRAEEQARIAEQERRQAEDERRRAESQQRRAEEEKQRAERLRRLSVAHELALKALQLPAGSDPALGALLAREAYALNLANRGDPDDPDIFAALWGMTRRLDSDRGDVLHRFPDEIRAFVLPADGSMLVASGEGSTVYLVDLRCRGDACVDLKRGEEPRELDARRELGEIEGRVRSLALDAAGRWVAAGTIAGVVRLWDLEAGGEPRTLIAHAASVTALAFRPGSKSPSVPLWRNVLASAGADGELRLWDFETGGGEGRQLSAPGSGALDGIAFRGDGAVLAVAGEQGLRRWRLDPAGDPVGELPTLGTGAVHAVAWSRDGAFLASGDASGTVFLWQPSDRGGEPRGELVGHTAAVEALAFHPVRDQLASASLDGSVRLWAFKKADARPIVMRDHDAWVWSVGYRPGGDHGFSGGSDRRIRRWQTHGALLVDEICDLAGRNLSAEEWRDYMPPDLDYRATCPGVAQRPTAAAGS